MFIYPRAVQLPRVHRSSFAADERVVRRIGARILAELLPLTTDQLAAVRRSLRSSRSREKRGGLPPGWVSMPRDPFVHAPQLYTSVTQKETVTVKAYRTESGYYFSSRQLLAAGALVFFSEKLRRYVHPTAGTLLDPHPRLQALSDLESQELEALWKEKLDRF
jgi:hypothetical protein